MEIEDAKVVSNEHVVVLTEKQKQIVANVLQTKAAIEAEYKKTVERETEIIVMLLEAKGISAEDIAGVSFKDGNLVATLKEK